MTNVTRFPLAKARALPGSTSRPAVAETAAAFSHERANGQDGHKTPEAAPPDLPSSSDPTATRRPSFLEVARNCIELARLAINGEFVEDVSVLRKKCDEDLLFASASEAHDGALRDAMWILLVNIKHYCEADSARRPVWARAIAVNKATLRDLYHLAVRA